MTWNRQQPDWVNWSFDARELEELEQQFLLGSGRLMGAWQHLKDQLKVSLLSDEAMKSSEIEGEFLDRDSVQSSVWHEHRSPLTACGKRDS